MIVEQLWQEFKEHNSQVAKEQLIIEYASLVKFVAGRMSIYLGSNVEFDDLVSYGYFGLIDAIDKFDIDKGVKFETYASLRVRGSILDSIRKDDWVPRSVRKKQKDIDKTYYELENRLGRSPSSDEMANALQLPLKDYHKMASQASVQSFLSVEEMLEQNQEGFKGLYNGNQNSLQPEEIFENNEMIDVLADAIKELNEKEQRVITLYYYEELTLKEISYILEVSESRISQIHSKAILRLRSKLTKNYI